MKQAHCVLLEWPGSFRVASFSEILKKRQIQKKQRNRKFIYSTRPLLVYYHFSTVFLPYNGNSGWWMGKWQIILHEGDSKKIMLLQGSDRKIISPKIQVRVSQNILYIHSGCIQWSFPAGKKRHSRGQTGIYNSKFLFIKIHKHHQVSWHIFFYFKDLHKDYTSQKKMESSRIFIWAFILVQTSCTIYSHNLFFV